ncbi:MAG: DUF3078 domain-containing protein [Saprospirales bacterium]|nr:DUF3078 domain-containing protein [Saprospirales bacterium]MBK8490059.1 DUF3078 domain-containing protein [Saprospirales bacterium]
MKKRLLLLSLILVATLWSASVFGQDAAAAATKEETPKNWTYGGGFGLDFAQLSLINPKVGSGANRIGFAGLANFTANYKKEKIAWNNTGSLQLGTQRVGGKNSPFEKNIDIIRLTSRASFRPGTGKLYGAVEADAITLLLPTYKGNVLKPEDPAENPIAKFLSPIQVMISPGLEYKFDDHLSLLYSPVSLKLIYVGDDNIAMLNVHGNKPGKNSFLMLGSNLKAAYNNKFLKEKLGWASSLDLFSNYLENPQNIDVLWTNDLGFTIVKNLSLNLVTQLFYDDDVNVQTDLDGDGIRGEAAADVDLPPGQQRSELIPSVSFMQGLFIKYNLLF